MASADMASKDTATAPKTVAELAAMSDDELRIFMKEHRGPKGNFRIPVDDLQRLSKDERNHLAERLKTQGRHLARSPTTSARPLDLNDLDARLLQISRRGSSPSQTELKDTEQTGRTTPDFSIDPTIWDEMWAVEELVKAGGRPLYPAEQVLEICTNPEDYAELLRPWQINIRPISAIGIFFKQLDRWENFRKWQNDNRGLDDDDGGFPAYLEKYKAFVIHGYQQCKERLPKVLEEFEADMPLHKSGWELHQNMRTRQRHFCREPDCNGFQDYAAAVKRRLRRHGFAQQFELDEDPKKQDQLTTWIEYLNYEYWWLDKHTSDIERLQPEHDEAWQKLVDMKILRPHETLEYVRSDASAFESDREEGQARRDLQRAEAQLKSMAQETSDGLGTVNLDRTSMLEAKSAQVQAAKRRLEQVTRHGNLMSNFIRETFGWSGAKRAASRHRITVQRVLEQVPLVQAEMADLEASRVISPARSRTKRKRTTSEESTGVKESKRLRLAGEDRGLLACSKDEATTVTNSALQGFGAARRMPEAPRRSARIAAEQATAEAASISDTRQPKPQLKRTPNAAQASRPPLPARSTRSLTGSKRAVEDVSRHRTSESTAEVLQVVSEGAATQGAAENGS